MKEEVRSKLGDSAANSCFDSSRVASLKVEVPVPKEIGGLRVGFGGLGRYFTLSSDQIEA